MKTEHDDPYFEKVELERKIRELVIKLQKNYIHQNMTEIFTAYSSISTNGYIYCYIDQCSNKKFIFECDIDMGNRRISIADVNEKNKIELVYHQQGDIRPPVTNKFKLLTCKKMDMWLPIVKKLAKQIAEEKRDRTKEKTRREVEEMKNNFDF
jgi:hypothetical protein